MLYYTAKEVAGMFKVSEQTIKNWIKAGRFPHAIKNGRWRIPEVDLKERKEDKTIGEPDELAKIEADTRKSQAETKRILADIELEKVKGIRDLPKTLAEKEADLSQREADVVIREQEVNKVIEKQSDKEDELERKEKAINEALEDIKVWREFITDDMEILRGYYSELCDKCKRVELPPLSEFKLNPDLITNTEKSSLHFEPEDLFDETEED